MLPWAGSVLRNAEALEADGSVHTGPFGALHLVYSRPIVREGSQSIPLSQVVTGLPMH